MRNVSYKSCRENQNTHFIINTRLRDNVEKYTIAGATTDENMALSHFTPGTVLRIQTHAVFRTRSPNSAVSS